MPSSIRFEGILSRTDNTESHETTSPLDELDESDVVWSSITPIATSGISEAVISESYPPTPLSTSSSVSSSTSPRQFHHPAAGLSAAIGSSDRHSRSPVVQRKKSAVSPLLSAAGFVAVSTVVAPSSSTSPISRSAPVKVPIWPDSRRIGKAKRGFDPTAVLSEFDEEVDEGSFDDEEMVPPHEIVARSHRTTTFSVFEGVGRTLKGRDLTRVRNAVMQKTGFLE